MSDLKTQLNSLIQLQALDSRIYALKQEKDAKPEEIKAIDSAFEEKKKSLSALETASLDLQKQKKERELELASKEEAAKKLQAQLYQLKTNKEYHTMLQQIGDTKADASVMEDKILQILDQVDKAKGNTEVEKKRLQEEEKVFNEKKRVIQERIKEMDADLTQLEGQRKQVLPNIEAKILSQYERILNNRDGLAIVLVKDNSCQGCNMFVPPQMINLIRMYSNIVTCEVCNRMLYIDNE